LSNRYIGYTLFYEALRGNTGVDYFNGKKQSYFIEPWKRPLKNCARNAEKPVSQYRVNAAMDLFVCFLGLFLM